MSGLTFTAIGFTLRGEPVLAPGRASVGSPHSAMPDYLSYSGHVYYSQSGQEAAVLSLLERKTNGFFIDIAANEPFQNSNTALLERHYGWRGVCIDAAKRSRRRFTETNRTCTFMLALTGDPTSETKSLLFREIVPPPNASPSTAWMHGLSSVVSSTAAPTCWGRHCLTVQELTRRGVKLMHRSMTPRSLDDILDEAKAPQTIDYMSLDVIPLAVLSNQCPSSTALEPSCPYPLPVGRSRATRRTCCVASIEKYARSPSSVLTLPHAPSFISATWCMHATLILVRSCGSSIAKLRRSCRVESMQR